ncbi:pentapeptide repeat-containing hypothetical protein [Candidatus Regiella insecticola LSR1]|uniref:Pentapeptide repeat-containing protein n=1 Tax=Candidatus Regiella insecticola LSR1 TaxID=663321 RepID=E0WUV7_9ENTR|nr:pentapeptide repeat-containing protein [Candidatus Regiella insecticola]EFL91196.1 pentapeptide repeat-containing hypothetical protein [Candidatus Regiella insecticola LSR1]
MNQEEKEFALHFANLKGVHFERTDLNGLNLEGVNFNQTSLSKVDFTASRLPSIDHFPQDIRGCIWQGASFEALIDTTPENINRIKQKLANMESIEANDFMQSVKQASFARLIKKINSGYSSLSYYGIRKLTDLNTIFNTQVDQPLCQLNGQSLFLDENRFKSSTVAAFLPNEIWKWDGKLNNNCKYEADEASDIILKYHQLQSAIALPYQSDRILDFNSLSHESKENILLYANLNGANLEGISCQNMDLSSSASFEGALLGNTDFSNTKLPSFDNFLDMEPQRLASCVWKDASCQKPADPKLEDIEKILELLQEVNSKDFTKMILNSLIHHGEGNILKRLLCIA